MRQTLSQFRQPSVPKSLTTDTLHDLELTDDGVLLVDFTSHYLFGSEGRERHENRRLNLRLEISPRQLAAVGRRMEVGRYDDAFLTILTIERRYPDGS